MTSLEQYATKYENVRMTRDDAGVLEVILHTDGDVLRWGEAIHNELWQAFTDITNDRDNRIMILTGAGDTFCTEFTIDVTGDDNPAKWDVVYGNGKRFLESILNIEIPVISALNGPCHVHPELFALADISLAAEHATVHDFHMGRLETPGGVVPGDGGAFIWMEVLGTNRGRYFLLTGQELTAAQGLEYGLFNEVVPAADLLRRAREIAGHLATNQTTLALRYTRAVFMNRFRRQAAAELGHGLAVEGLALIDMLQAMKAAPPA